MFRTQMLRTIFGSTIDSITHLLRIWKNMELSELYTGPDIVNEIKGMRLRWTEHV